jgi:hypothetical protein
MNLHRRLHRRRSGPLVTISVIALGIVLLAGGFFLGLVPGVPGFVLGFLGIALIAAQVRPLAKWVDRTEAAMRRLVQKVRGPVASPSRTNIQS